MRAGKLCWGRCLRCDTRVMIRRRELDTRRGARCPHCGGPVEVSRDQGDRTTAARDGNTDATERREQLTEGGKG